MARGAIGKGILKKSFSKEIKWRWVIILTSVYFLVGMGFLIYQLTSPNRGTTQFTPAAQQNETPIPLINSGTPTPSV